VRAGTEIRVDTERTEMDLHVNELDAGSWVILQIAGFTKADSGTAVDSVEALRKATTTAYYKGKDALWVKLVVTDKDFQGPVVEPVGRLVAQATIHVAR